MIKSLNLILIFIIIVSCNTAHKNNNNHDYSMIKNDSTTNPKLKESINRGKLVYEDMCLTCHMEDGKGAANIFPPLANSDYLKNDQDASIRAIKNGMSGEIIVNGITYNSVMNPMGLSNEEVADVMNYINNSWENTYGKTLTAEEVTKVIKK